MERKEAVCGNSSARLTMAHLLQLNRPDTGWTGRFALNEM